MSSVYEEIKRLETAKSDIETAIETCGVNVPDDELINAYASYISQIPLAVFSKLNLEQVGSDNNSFIKWIKQTNGVIEAAAGGLVSNLSSGLAPQIDLNITDRITTSEDGLVLTSTKEGTSTWKKLPINAFKNDDNNTTYTFTSGTGGFIVKPSGGADQFISIGKPSTAGTADKLSTVSQTAWGQTYWTSDGVPTSISGNMTGVGNITPLMDTTYNIGTSSNLFKYIYTNGIYAKSGSWFGIGANNTDHIRITTDGNVGIGTTTPTHKLHVNGSAKIGGNLLIGANNSQNYIAFHGTTGDNPGSYNHTYIGENLWGGSESSELVLYKGNDVGTTATTVSGSGADRIRHIAGAHLFQIYKSALSGTFDSICKSSVPINMLAIHQRGVEIYSDLYIGGTDAKLYLKTANAGTLAYLAAYNTGGSYGADVVLNSGSALVLGAGESAAAMHTNNVDSLQTSENLYLTADGSVKIFTNCDTIANSKHVATFSNNGYAYFNSYINIGGHEKNTTTLPTYVWGSNDTDSFLRSYKTSILSVGYASNAGSASSIGSGALKHMCSLYTSERHNAYKIVTDWNKSNNIMPTINIRGYAYGTSMTIDCDIVMYHYNNTAINYSLTNKGSYPIRVWQNIENDVQVFYISPGEYFGMFNVFIYGGMGTNNFNNWTMTTADTYSGTEISSKPIATSITGNAATATKLTSSAGSATIPIYFSDGKPVACTASSVFSNLSNSGNNLSITVAGQNRTLTVAYASSAGNATTASYLPTVYGGGDKPDPQYYFNYNVGVKVAMTRYANIGGTSSWFDTLWINGYAGGDVPNMVALTTIRNGTPRAFLSAQSNRSNTYGDYYEIISSYNIGSQSVNYSTSSGIARALGTDDSMKLYALIGNEINFGGTNSSNTIYFGYRAKDSKPIPTNFVFGGGDGSATLKANGFSKKGSDNSYVLLGGGDHKALSDCTIPAGTIAMWGGASAPSGWLLCDGTSYSRTTYEALYKVIGTTYGNNSSTTFNVPNLKQRFPLGACAGTWSGGNQSYATQLGSIGGEAGHKLTVDEMPSHNHTLNVYKDDDGGGGAAEKLTPYSNGEAGSTASHYSASSGYPSISTKGGSLSHNNIPPYLAVNFIIKY